MKNYNRFKLMGAIGFWRNMVLYCEYSMISGHVKLNCNRTISLLVSFALSGSHISGACLQNPTVCTSCLINSGLISSRVRSHSCLLQISQRLSEPITIISFSAPRKSRRFCGITIRPCLSGSASQALENKYRWSSAA